MGQVYLTNCSESYKVAICNVLKYQVRVWTLPMICISASSILSSITLESEGKGFGGRHSLTHSQTSLHNYTLLYTVQNAETKFSFPLRIPVYIFIHSSVRLFTIPTLSVLSREQNTALQNKIHWRQCKGVKRATCQTCSKSPTAQQKSHCFQRVQPAWESFPSPPDTSQLLRTYSLKSREQLFFIPHQKYLTWGHERMKAATRFCITSNITSTHLK